MKNYIYTGIAASLCTMLFLSSCSKDDDQTIVPPAIVPSSISFNLSDDINKQIYSDETGAKVLPLKVGQTVSLPYVMEPDSATFKDVVWTSSNNSVATVDNYGTVSALSSEGSGYSIIQVAPEGLYAGSGIYASLKVMVYSTVVSAEAISITSTADELFCGDTLHLNAVISPSNTTFRTVEWSSSNENIATVDIYGVLTASTTNDSEVTITATALDGSGVKATKVITVNKKVLPESVTIDQTYSVDNDYYCAMNEQSITLSYTTVPEKSTTSEIVWTSSDESIATVDNGVVTFNQEGNFGNVEITATCPNGSSSTITLGIPAGLIRETYHNASHYSWYNASQSGNNTSSSHEWHDGYITVTTYTVNATTQRADIKCWDLPAYLHAGNYPIFAIKMDDVKDQGISSRNINFDAVGTSESGTQYKAIANGNNKYLHDYKCSDGSHVFIYDLSTQQCGTGGLMPTNEYVKFNTLQLKYADMKTATSQLQYNIYWVQTFKSLDDVVKYITDTDNLSYEVIK